LQLQGLEHEAGGNPERAGWSCLGGLAPFMNFDEVLTLLASAGAGLTIVIAFHGVQIIFFAAAWRIVTGPTNSRYIYGNALDPRGRQ
jgi:hypothetical protein